MMKSGRPTWPVTVLAMLLSWVSTAGAQTGAPLQARPVAPQDGSPSVRATPALLPPRNPVPAVPGAAMSPPGAALLPPQSSRTPPNAGVPGIRPGQATGPTGPTVSARQTRARVIESDRPERVKVYPEDPDSAWWEINPSYAFARAQREQKPLMLLFTAIWNAQCLALSEEVFSTKSFNEYVKENLVICYLNYPRNVTDAPDALRRIKEKFKVKGYPNVILFNPNGEVLRGITGYRSGRPVDYFRELKTVCHPVLLAVEEQRKRLEGQGFRDWSNYEGKMIFARFRRRDDTLVTLQDVTGQEWTVPINDLAPDDQRLVESHPVIQRAPGGDEE